MQFCLRRIEVLRNANAENGNLDGFFLALIYDFEMEDLQKGTHLDDVRAASHILMICSSESGIGHK